jgi:DnaJ-class molecular chaperone
MSTKTHYTVLELVPTAAPGVIRAAYKAHALMFHPDKTAHLSAGERAIRSAVFNEVQAAYDVLGNPALKAAYDATLAYKNNESNAQRSNAHPPISNSYCISSCFEIQLSVHLKAYNHQGESSYAS